MDQKVETTPYDVEAIRRDFPILSREVYGKPLVYLDNADLAVAIAGVDMAEIAITSSLEIADDRAHPDAFSLSDVSGVSVIVGKAEERGLTKCARSWRYTDDVGNDPEFPDVSARDARVLRELESLGRL